MRVVTLSDTHGKERILKMPPGDVVIFCGDCETHTKDTMDFLGWFASLDYKYKIMVAGNHDYLLYNKGYQEAHDLCKNLGIIYLQDTSVVIEGIKIHGSPWSTIFGDWPFMADDFELDQHWQKIPQDTNILITHSPQYGTGDTVRQTFGGNPKVGSRTLARRIADLPDLKYHLFGHIHESYGIYKNSKYTSYNASIYDYFLGKINDPWVFNI